MSPKSTVLIVDDEPDFVRLLEANLQAYGYRVLTAYNGRAGTEMVMQENPDLVILDLMMPDTWESNQINILRFVVKFDTGENWYTGGGIPAANQLDAIGVATHELGHGLGLDHTQVTYCGANPATMCATYNYGQTYWRNLESDDRNGCNAKYP